MIENRIAQTSFLLGCLNDKGQLFRGVWTRSDALQEDGSVVLTGGTVVSGADGQFDVLGLPEAPERPLDVLVGIATWYEAMEVPAGTALVEFTTPAAT